MNYPPRILKDYVDWRVATDDVGLDVFASCGEGDFADAAERALLIAINELEGMASELRGSREPRLSALICKFVRLMGVPCVAEGLTNGHVDITITHPRRPELVMLGECKIWDGYDWHLSGCQQLLRRYATGRCRRSACIEFFDKPGMYGFLTKLMSEFDSLLPESMVGVARVHAVIKGAFVTSHHRHRRRGHR
jgi:hypothetical protein